MYLHPGYDGSNGNEQQHQQHSVTSTFQSTPAEYLVPHTQLELGHSIARTAYPCADTYIGGIMAAYGAQAMIDLNFVLFIEFLIGTISSVISYECKQKEGIHLHLSCTLKGDPKLLFRVLA
eukprot:Gb_31428 [translate_table: standard]